MGLHEARRDGHETLISPQGILRFEQGQTGACSRGLGPHGVGLAVKESIVADVGKGGIVWSVSVRN